MLCRNVKLKLVNVRSSEGMKPGAIFQKLEWGQGFMVKFLCGTGNGQGEGEICQYCVLRKKEKEKIKVVIEFTENWTYSRDRPFFLRRAQSHSQS